MATARQALRLAHDQALRVYWQDEARFGRMDNPTASWAPRGVRPSVATQRVRQSSYLYGALCPQDGALCSMILPYADTERMELFMDAFAAHLDGAAALLIMDQAAWHKSSPVRKHPNIHIAYQPPYSPQLNPVENFWKHLRGNHMKNRAWKSLDELEQALESALHDYLQNPAQIRSITKYPWMVGL